MHQRGQRRAVEAGCEEELKPGELRFLQGVRYGLYHGRPRELWINLALCWKVSKSRGRNPRRKQPGEPWYLATSLDDPKSAASWYWQRGWIEQSFKVREAWESA